VVEAPERVEAFRLRAEETLDGVRWGIYPETAVDVVDCERVRRDLTIWLGYCWDAGEVVFGGCGPCLAYGA